MIVGKITQSEVKDAIIQNAICPRCNNYFNAYMLRSENNATIFFVPILKKTIRCYTICPHCGINYDLKPRIYKEIISQNSPELLYRECYNFLDKTRNRMNSYVIRSKKKVSIASILAFFLGIFGIQNLYMGHTKRFIAAISIFIFSIFSFCISIFFADVLTLEDFAQFTILLCSAGLAINVYWGIIDSIRILLGHAKDGNGLYIMTKRQYNLRMKNRKNFI